MEKILSIIIPTYNMERYLRKCLDSLIIGSKFNAIEVLVINDGSKDSSSAIAHEYQDKYPHVYRVIDKENGNYGSCINRGLKEATGKYVKVLDSDDYFDTSSLNDLVTSLLTVDVDMVVTDFDIVNELGTITKHESFNYPHKQPLTIEKFYEMNPGKVIQMHAITYRRQMLINMHYHQSEGISYTDQEWIYVPIPQVQNVVYYRITLYKYLLGRLGQTVDKEQHLRNITHSMQGSLVMLDSYNSCSKDVTEQMRGLIFTLLISRIIAIYRLVLIHNHQIDNLKIFDESIRNSNMDVYRYLDQVSLFPLFKYFYIRVWRKNDMLPKYVIYMYNMVCKFKSLFD